MQSELLDITIIGCLVLLFASTYRKRTTPMVRSWTWGWLLILVHFTVLLFHPVSDFQQRTLQAICLGALVACGVMFLLAAANKEDTRKEPHIAWPLTGGAAWIAFIALVIWDVQNSLPYYALVLLGTAAWLGYSVRLHRTSSVIRILLFGWTLTSTVWLFWTILYARQDVGVSAILTQIYFSVGLIYTGTFRRISGGALTVVSGLLAWAAVFPAAEFCRHLGVAGRISPEFWNVPKYFVAFGMILILLEEEIIAANAASKHYRLLFEANPHPMWIYDRRTLDFQAVNDAAVSQYGYTRDEFLGMNLRDISAAAEIEEADEEPGRTLDGRHSLGPRRHKKKNGSPFFVDVATHHIQSQGRDVAFSLVQDVTERQELHQRLLYQANHDLLTGLPNRAWIEAQLRQTLALAEDGRQCALLCLDVDRFKQINDTYGHGVGDLCLREVARRLALRIGQKETQDAVARVGGEEFILLLDHVTDRSAAEEMACDILAVLQTPIHANGYAIELTASIGIAFYPQDGTDAATLWRNADCAMYRAKRAGGNQYLCMSPEISRLTTEANELELQLRRALRNDAGLEVHYQPLYHVDGALHSLEALVRMRDPELALISPERFVPVAEESGLIVPLGNWVLNEVCRQSAAWTQEGLPQVRIALNISPLQITRPDFSSHVGEVVARHRIDPHLLGMEITETAMMHNTGEAARQMKTLADLGIGFSVDDFGTGYSSLGQLDKLPVQLLKIDRMFIRRMCRPEGTYSIVDAIISMAHSLQLEVVAEGVESQEQWACLRQLNCDVVQGFLFSRPLPAEEIPSLLQQSSAAYLMSAGHIEDAQVA